MEEVSQQSAQPTQKLKLTPPQVQAIKNSMIGNLRNVYTQFITAVQGLPGIESAMFEAFEYLDAGFLSLQKAIILAPAASLPVIQMVNPLCAPAQDAQINAIAEGELHPAATQDIPPAA